MSDKKTEETKEVKVYPIEALVLMSGNIIEVAEVIEVYSDAYRVKTPYDTVRLVFFSAIAYVDNGEGNV